MMLADTSTDFTESQYQAAVKIVRDSKRGSISLVQRVMKTRYAVAAAMLQRMECEGIVSHPFPDSYARRVLELERGE